LFDHVFARYEEFRKAKAPMTALLKTSVEIAAESAAEAAREETKVEEQRRVIANGRRMGLKTKLLARILDISEDDVRALERSLSSEGKPSANR